MLVIVFFSIPFSNDETQVVVPVVNSAAEKEVLDFTLRKAEINVRKIILTTNIMESSVTVPDAKYGKLVCLLNIRFLVNSIFFLLHFRSH